MNTQLIFSSVPRRALRKSRLAVASVLATSFSLLAGAPAVQTAVQNQFAASPIAFEQNEGQTNAPVRFLARSLGMTTFLTDEGATVLLRQSKAAQGAAVRLRWQGAQAGEYRGLQRLSSVSHAYLGNDPAAWRQNISQYARVKRSGLYPGIDLVYYGQQRQLEYDFLVAPGADPSRIRMSVEGAQSLRLDANGDLLLRTVAGELRQKRPVAYQEQDGQRVPVEASYRLRGQEVRLALAQYDRARPLVIDPVLAYATYLGGSGYDFGYGIAVASNGDTFVTGLTTSPNLPNATGSVSTGYDVMVVRLNSVGTPVYSAYLGGTGNDYGLDITTDGQGSAYVTGYTASTNFPTANPSQAFNAGSEDGFVARLGATGTLLFSTYVGGNTSDTLTGIGLDSAGNIWVAGSTSGGLTTVGAVQSTYGGGISDAMIARLSAANGAVNYLTYLGGTGEDAAYGLAVDGQNGIVVGGVTNGGITTLNAAQGTFGGGKDGFVVRLNNSGALIYSTYFGAGNLDQVNGVAADSTGNAYVTGQAGSGITMMNPAQASFGGGTYDAFVAKYSPSGSMVYSTYMGGGLNDYGQGIAVDSSGAASIVGHTLSTNFPILSAWQTSLGGQLDVFVARLNSSGAKVYASFLGGPGNEFGQAIGVDGQGNTYVTGGTDGNFPVKNASQGTYGGNSYDAFLAKVNPQTSGGGATNAAIYRSGLWLVDTAGTGSNFTQYQFGFGGTQAIAGDWNGSGTSKLGVFNPANGQWLIDVNGNGLWNGTGIDLASQFGVAGDLPVSGDWTGDGKTKLGVYRPSVGTFYLDLNGSGIWNGEGIDQSLALVSPQAGDVPVVGDWTGDGKAKVGLFRAGVWYLWTGTQVRSVQFGFGGAIPVVGDWNGSGTAKVGVFDPASGIWYVDYNGDGFWNGAGIDRALQFGFAGVTPVVGDWNGDGRTKVGVFYNGTWYFDLNGNYVWEGAGVDRALTLGQAGDQPVVGKWQ